MTQSAEVLYLLLLMLKAKNPVHVSNLWFSRFWWSHHYL